MPKSHASLVKKEDRLFSLILALLASRDGLTKNDILSSVRGYAEVYSHESNATLEKMFERDKSELRNMGVVIDTLEPPGEEGETHNVRYVITHRNFDIPDSLTFTPEEITLMIIASQAWREGSLSSDSRHAIAKLQSLGVEPSGDLIGVAPVISTYEKAFDVVTEALRSEKILEFTYLKPGELKAQHRTASPLAVVLFNGFWHMLAYDLDAQAERTFLLRRIVGNISTVPQKTHPRDSKNYAQQLLDELQHRAQNHKALIWVEPASDAELQLSSRFPSDSSTSHLINVPYTDIDLLADELVRFCGSIRIVEPEDLAERMRYRLRAIEKAHI